MKKKKLNLKDLQVSSFITSMNASETAPLKGGTETTCAIGCGPTRPDDTACTPVPSINLICPVTQERLCTRFC